jgi:hypothetical protein
MTIGQRERIVYRIAERAGREGSFLPPGGIGYGLGEGLGLVLNRVVRGPSKFRTSHNTIVGLVVEETSDYIIVERKTEHRVKILTSDIIERVALR